MAQREDRLKNATYGELDKKNANGNFRVPDVELLDRTFNESSRFYAIGPSQKKHGLKYVAPPVAENLKQLVEDQIRSDNRSPNFLLNSRYARSRVGSRGEMYRANTQVAGGPDYNDTKSIVSILSDTKVNLKTMTNPRSKRDDSIDTEQIRDVIDPEKFKQINKTVLNTLNDKDQKENSERMKYLPRRD